MSDQWYGERQYLVALTRCSRNPLFKSSKKSSERLWILWQAQCLASPRWPPSGVLRRALAGQMTKWIMLHAHRAWPTQFLLIKLCDMFPVKIARLLLNLVPAEQEFRFVIFRCLLVAARVHQIYVVRKIPCLVKALWSSMNLSPTLFLLYLCSLPPPS